LHFENYTAESNQIWHNDHQVLFVDGLNMHTSITNPRWRIVATLKSKKSLSYHLQSFKLLQENLYEVARVNSEPE